MVRWWIERKLRAFERAYDYDMGYARAILEVDPRAMVALSKAIALPSYRKDIPPSPFFAAKIAATMAEDCGPCLQLSVRMAEKAGVAPEVIAAVLRRDESAMPEDVALAHRFARAVLARSPDADALRDAVVARWGRRALVSLSVAMAASALFPRLKYGLGFGQACAIVRVGQTPVPVREHEPA